MSYEIFARSESGEWKLKERNNNFRGSVKTRTEARKRAISLIAAGLTVEIVCTDSGASQDDCDTDGNPVAGDTLPRSRSRRTTLH